MKKSNSNRMNYIPTERKFITVFDCQNQKKFQQKKPHFELPKQILDSKIKK
jgi:hypothetical protein